MLAVLSTNICVSYLPWYTFVPIMSTSMAVYDVQGSQLNVLCILYSLVYIPGVFLTGTLLNAFGCRACFILATGCMAAGCAVRCGPSAICLLASCSPPGGAPRVAPFPWLAAGQALCAVGQTFLVNATTQLGAEWFPQDERPAAAMISNLMNFVGGSLSFVVPTWYVSQGAPIEAARAQVADLLLVQLEASLLALLMTAALYRDPPAGRGGARAETPLFGELWRAMSLRDFWLVGGNFVIYLAVLNTFDAVEGELLVSYGYSEALSSWTAISFCATSVLSTAAEAALIRHPAHYRGALVAINCLLCASCVAGWCCLRGGLPEWCFVAVLGVMGFSTPGWGCSLEMGSEVCYPAREATVSSLMEALGSVASVLCIVVAQWLIDAGFAGAVLLGMAAAALLGAVALLGISGHLRRSAAEDELEAQQPFEEEAALAPPPPKTNGSPSAGGWFGHKRRRRGPGFEAEFQLV